MRVFDKKNTGGAVLSEGVARDVVDISVMSIRRRALTAELIEALSLRTSIREVARLTPEISQLRSEIGSNALIDPMIIFQKGMLKEFRGVPPSDENPALPKPRDLFVTQNGLVFGRAFNCEESLPFCAGLTNERISIHDTVHWVRAGLTVEHLVRAVKKGVEQLRQGSGTANHVVGGISLMDDRKIPMYFHSGKK